MLLAGGLGAHVHSHARYKILTALYQLILRPISSPVHRNACTLCLAPVFPTEAAYILNHISYSSITPPA